MNGLRLWTRGGRGDSSFAVTCGDRRRADWVWLFASPLRQTMENAHASLAVKYAASRTPPPPLPPSPPPPLPRGDTPDRPAGRTASRPLSAAEASELIRTLATRNAALALENRWLRSAMARATSPPTSPRARSAARRRRPPAEEPADEPLPTPKLPPASATPAAPSPYAGTRVRPHSARPRKPRRAPELAEAAVAKPSLELVTLIGARRRQQVERLAASYGPAAAVALLSPRAAKASPSPHAAGGRKGDAVELRKFDAVVQAALPR